MNSTCPKCGHKRTEEENADYPDWQCPSCGIAYAKFNSTTNVQEVIPSKPTDESIHVESPVVSTSASSTGFLSFLPLEAWVAIAALAPMLLGVFPKPAYNIVWIIGCLIVFKIYGPKDEAASNSNEPKPTSSFATAMGVISIVIGVIAFFWGLMPLFGIAGLFLGLVGALFALVGIAGGKGTSSVGVPKAGLIVSLVPVVWQFIFVAGFVGGVASIGNDVTGGPAEDSPAAQVEAPASPVRQSNEPVLEARAAKPQPDFLFVRILEKGFFDGAYEDQITFKYEFYNTGADTISAVDGVMVFTDLFDRVIMRSNLYYDVELRTGDVQVWNAGIDYNQFKDSHQQIRSTDLSKMKYRFEVERLLFKSGRVATY